jgi:hypothetical protein
MSSELAIKTCAKLYESRDTARKLFGDKYAERIREASDIIQSVMRAQKCSEMIAGMKILESMKHDYSAGMTQLLFAAAIVELVEPTTGVIPCPTKAK